MKVVHGSKVKNIDCLFPQYIAGANGSQDGIGVNLTENIDLALNYATKKGSVYIVDLDLDGFLDVSDDARLTESQSKRLISELSLLDEKLLYRFATDICGKEKHAFNDDGKAEEFYKMERLKIKGLNLGLDRMMPSIDDNDMSSFTILTARKDFDFTDISTSHIHYCLNLYDNQLATELLKTISTGLILNRGEKEPNYLSFRPSEAVLVELCGDLLERPDCKNLIKHACQGDINLHTKLEYSSVRGF